ncbi:X-linked lymphocyte-regulated protein 3B [Lemmus lemmus]
MVTRLYFNTEPLKNFLQGNKERFAAIITESLRSLKQKFEELLKIQYERREECSHQFMTLVVMWNIDVHQCKEHAKKLSTILDEQQQLFEEFQVIHKQKIEEFKDLCDQHLKKLTAVKSRCRKAIIEEARKQMDIVERKISTETEEETGVQSSFLSLLFS